MGVLEPLCVAQGSLGEIYSFALGRTDERSNYVIAKSNASPAALTDIYWSTVATISTSAFSRFDKAHTCVVSDQGVFTIFGNTKWISESEAYGYMVLRYDPSAPPMVGTGSTGPGGWMNVTVSDSYTLDRNASTKSQAFYVNVPNSGGLQTLIHLVVDTLRDKTLQFGILNEESTVNTLSHAANWTESGPSYTKLKSVAYSNNELYVYWTPGPNDSRVSVYPLSVYPNLTQTIPPIARALDANTTANICFDSDTVFSGALLNNALHLVCAFDGSSARNTTLYTINNSSRKGSSASSGIPVTRPLGDIDFFMLESKYALMLEASSQGVYGLELSGANAGTVWGPRDVSVSDSFGTKPESKDSTGMIVGVVMGVLVVAAVLLYGFSKRSQIKKRRMGKVAVDDEIEMKGHETQRVDESAVVTAAQGPGPHHMNTASQPHLTGTHPYTPGQPLYPTPQPAPIAIPGTSVTPSAPDWAEPPLYQSAQDQMQHLQFSSHPRPNVVTTVS